MVVSSSVAYCIISLLPDQWQCTELPGRIYVADHGNVEEFHADGRRISPYSGSSNIPINLSLAPDKLGILPGHHQPSVVSMKGWFNPRQDVQTRNT